MKRFLIAAVTCLALIVGVSPAAAGSGLGGVLDTATQTVQRNTNTAGDATASNWNGTGQSNEQSQVGSGGAASTGDATAGGSGDATSGDAYGGDVDQSQSASNTNTTTQNAQAVSEARQVVPVNVNVPVCIAKDCETGAVEQSNANRSGDAKASNGNGTQQSNEQSQKGYGGDATTGDATTGGKCCTNGRHEKPKHASYGKPEHPCDGCDGHGKPRCDDPCRESQPKHVCERGGKAQSGDAKGGDVAQRQQAQNDNRTEQKAEAASITKQVEPINVPFGDSPWQQKPRSCRVC